MMAPMPQRFAVAVTIFYLPIALAAFIWIAWRAGAEGLHSRLVGAHPFRDLLIGSGLGVLAAFGSRALARGWGPGRSLERGLQDLIGPLSPAACALMALVSGIAEEMAFRAALQPEIGLLWTSLLFGAVHAPLRRELWAWPILAAGMGLVLGATYQYTEALPAPAAAHVVVNWLNLLHLAKRAAQARPPADGPAARSGEVDALDPRGPR